MTVLKKFQIVHHLLYVTLLPLSDITTDDRFILKQMPRLEVQSFLDFAPHYFTYITNAVQQKVLKKNPFVLGSVLYFTD